MNIRLQADNDLNQLIVAAVFRREPKLDFRTARSAQLHQPDDLAVLSQAAADNRILVTHDKRTMRRNLTTFLMSGHQSPGVLLVIPQDAPLRSVVETLVLIWADD